MKKVTILSALAVAALALTCQDAFAWKQFKFGVGMNLEGSAGGNNLLWGLYKSQQPPSPGYGGFPGGYPGQAGPGFGGFGGMGGFGGYGGVGGMGYSVGQELAPTPSALPPGTVPNRVQPVNYQPFPAAPTGYYLPGAFDSYLPPY
jgi:hypothetical protein